MRREEGAAEGRKREEGEEGGGKEGRRREEGRREAETKDQAGRSLCLCTQDREGYSRSNRV